MDKIDTHIESHEAMSPSVAQQRRRKYVSTQGYENNYKPSEQGMDYNEISLDDDQSSEQA